MIWELKDEQMIVAFAFVCTAAFICGWIADRIMATAGFGVIGNWLLLFVGASVGLYTYNLYGYTLTHNGVYTIGIAGMGGTVMLMVLATIKSATHS